MSVTLNLVLSILLALVIAGIVGSLSYFFYASFIKKVSKEEIYKREMESILEDDEGEYYTKTEDVVKESIFDKWNNMWIENLLPFFPDRYSAKYGNEPKNAGVDVIFIWAILCVTFFLLIQSIPMAILIASGVIGASAVLLRIKFGKKEGKMRDQIVSFLYALKANIQAGESPERALVKIVDNIPSPLGDELLIVKHQILSNTPFKEALISLRESTTSDDLRFLCSCMIQSSLTGSSIESQIDTIIDIVTKKKELADKISEETRSSDLSKWIAAILIPAMFVIVYVIDDSAREFWFIDPASYPIFGVVVLLYLAAFYLSNKKVKKVKELAK